MRSDKLLGWNWSSDLHNISSVSPWLHCGDSRPSMYSHAAKEPRLRDGLRWGGEAHASTLGCCMSSLDLSRFLGLAHLDRDLSGEIPPRLADLAVSFPLLFFMLASDSGSFGRRMQAARLAELGAPLADVADAYGLPLSLRRIPPEACSLRLPWVGWSRDAGPQLANHIPDATEKIASWLPPVFHAARLCDEHFAIWIARQRARAVPAQLDHDPLHGHLARELCRGLRRGRSSGAQFARCSSCSSRWPARCRADPGCTHKGNPSRS